MQYSEEGREVSGCSTNLQEDPGKRSLCHCLSLTDVLKAANYASTGTVQCVRTPGKWHPRVPSTGGSSNQLEDIWKRIAFQEFCQHLLKLPQSFNAFVSPLSHGETQSNLPQAPIIPREGTHLLPYIKHQRIPWGTRKRSSMESLQDSKDLSRK